MARCPRGRDAARVEHGSTLQRQRKEAGVSPASSLLDGAIAEGQVVRAGAELQRAAGAEDSAFFQCAQFGRLLIIGGGQPGQDIALVIAGLDERFARHVAGNAQRHGGEGHRLVEFFHAQRGIAGFFKGLVERRKILCGVGGQRREQAEGEGDQCGVLQGVSQSWDPIPWRSWRG
ncbi:hypothetical protein G6F59_015355 [Rhizopus arrhizus]|nr:hypothetical protein G6F59_015355 [Rhizopus arrhizus]